MTKLKFVYLLFVLGQNLHAQSLSVGASLPYYVLTADDRASNIKNNLNYSCYFTGTKYEDFFRMSYSIGFGSRNFQYNDYDYRFKRQQNILVPFAISAGVRLFSINKHTLAIDIGLAANWVMYDHQQRTNKKGLKVNTLMERSAQIFLPLTFDYAYRCNKRWLLHIGFEEALSPGAIINRKYTPSRFYTEPELANTFQFRFKVGLEYLLNYNLLPFYQIKEKKE